MKKILICLLTLIFTLSFGISALAAEKKLTDFEGLSASNINTDLVELILPQGATTVTYETDNPISGKQSLSFTADASSGESSYIFLKPYGNVTDWSGYDYVSMRVQNLDTENYVTLLWIFDQTAKDTTGAERVARAVPTMSEYVILRDTQNKEVYVDYIDGFMILPEGFDGTIYLPMHAKDMEFVYPHSNDYTIDQASCTYKSLKETIYKFFSPEKTFSGSILLDDIKLIKESDIPPKTLTTTTAAPTTTAPSTPTTTTPEPSTSTPVNTLTASVTPSGAAPATTTGTPTSTGTATPPKSNTGLIIGIIAAVLIIAAAATFFIIKNKKKAVS